MYDTVICIPYRNRKAHLDYFLANSVPLLEHCFPDAHVVVVEQSDDGRLFNRGKLLNVAFHEYKDRATYCMTHDVDLNPTEETVLTQYVKPTTEVLGIYTSSHNTLGGIIKTRLSTMYAVNGFPNTFWGWGVEDKALQNRVEFYNVGVTKTLLSDDPLRHRAFTIFDDVDDRVRSSEFEGQMSREYTSPRQLPKETRRRRIEADGLSTLSYRILSTAAVLPNVTHLVVEL